MALRQRQPATREALSGTAKKIEQKIEKALTVLWDDLPSWQQDNHFIRSGYRPASASFWLSFASLGYLHNESVNIYSHLLGALGFSLAGVVLYSVIKPRYESANLSDILAFGCFFAGAALCLGMSATYHAISNHSPTVASFGNKLDYVGIVFLITGSFIPSIFYGFYCHSHLQEFYWTMVCSSFRAVIYVYISDTLIDILARIMLRDRVHRREVSDSSMAAVPRRNVCCARSICCVSNLAWPENVWIR